MDCHLTVTRFAYLDAMAVVITAKSATHPGGHEIRVVEDRTGEVT